MLFILLQCKYKIEVVILTQLLPSPFPPTHPPPSSAFQKQVPFQIQPPHSHLPRLPFHLFLRSSDELLVFDIACNIVLYSLQVIELFIFF